MYLALLLSLIRQGPPRCACRDHGLNLLLQVLVAMTDHLINMIGPSACGVDGQLVWEAVWSQWSPLQQQQEATADPANITTLKQLSVAPIASHHQVR